VNCGQSSGPTSQVSPGTPPVTNCPLFINNRTDNGEVGQNVLANLGGFTQVFSFVAPVNPNVTNHMHLSIADTSDAALDSAVFIAGGTLSVCGGPNQPPCNGGGGGGTVPEPGTLLLLGAAGLVATARRALRRSAS
jgi:PEP-CTERM motif-containing protein